MDWSIQGKAGFFTIPYYVLGQDWQIFISDQPLDGIIVTPFEAPYQQSFENWKINAEKALFYGSVNLEKSESLFAYYEPIYRVIIQGNINQIIEELTLLEGRLGKYPARGHHEAALHLSLSWMSFICLNT